MSETTVVSAVPVKSTLVRKGLIVVGAVAGVILASAVIAKIKSNDDTDSSETINV